MKHCNSTWIHRALCAAVAGALLLCAGAFAAHVPANRAKAGISVASGSDKARTRALDAELAGKVKGALYATFGAGAGEIAVTVQNGFVSLYGEVRTDSTRAKAERIASRVLGVRAVSNKLEIGRNG